MPVSELARFIDHTLLKPGASSAQIDRLCDEAIEHRFFSVCVHPIWVEHVAKRLELPEVKVCTVVAFPHGECRSESKAHQTRLAVRSGAQEIDMVLARSLVHAGRWAAVHDEVARVVEAAQGALVKVILESASLRPDEIVGACERVVEAGAGFVKTSTGFGEGGATLKAVRIMRESVGPEFGVKASGGVRDAASARAMIEAGANRLGCRASVAIVSS